VKQVLKIFLIILLSAMPVSVFAYQECLITTDGKLSDIKIEHNDIIDVYPLITIMNDKNTLIVHPLKEGSSKFIVTKGGKEKLVFSVNVSKKETIIDQVDGVDIFQIDTPPVMYEYDLDEPPLIKGDEVS